MNKQSKWLLVGSLICLGLGSGFHMSYGMKRNFEDNEPLSNKEQKRSLLDDNIEIIDSLLSDEEYVRKQNALESDISKDELETVEQKIFTYKQIVIGYKYWDKFNRLKDSIDVTDKEKLTLLTDAAVNHNEDAVVHLLYAYLFGWYGLQANNPEGLKLAIKYVEKGSENAIDHFLGAYEHNRYGLQKYDPEVFKLVVKLALDGDSRALAVFNQHKDKVKPNFNKRNDKQIPFSDVDLLFN